MKLLCLDCDSTLSEIEGVDELAAPRGNEVKQQIVDLTNQAMSGEIAIEEIFGKRLGLIKPTKQLCEEVGQLYIDKASESVKESLDNLRAKGWIPIIISGGFIDPIKPFAKFLEIDEIYAVPLHFNKEGEYESFTASPTTRNGGKPEILQELIEKYNPEVTVMVGDGVSDLECQGVASLFIGYGEYEAREKVKASAEEFAYNFSEIEKILEVYS